MGDNFYERWIDYWDQEQAERQKARKVIHAEELSWLETRQDYQTAAVISRDTGFATGGMSSYVAVIPPGCRTGVHSHGEEAIYIIAGTGYSVIDGVTYDWRPGTFLAIGFGAAHCHFNSGETEARYLSLISVDLERFFGIHRTFHLEDKARIAPPRERVSEDGYLPDGSRRIRLYREEMMPIVDEGKGVSKYAASDSEIIAGNSPEVGDLDGMYRLMHTHKYGYWDAMRVGTDMNDFTVHEQMIGGIISDNARSAGGQHAHMEAQLYILRGSGYSIVDEERVDWRVGSGLHITGPQTVHQHFNESDEPSEMLRMLPGPRLLLFEPAAKNLFPYLYLAKGPGSSVSSGS